MKIKYLNSFLKTELYDFSLYLSLNVHYQYCMQYCLLHLHVLKNLYLFAELKSSRTPNVVYVTIPWNYRLYIFYVNHIPSINSKYCTLMYPFYKTLFLNPKMAILRLFLSFMINCITVVKWLQCDKKTTLIKPRHEISNNVVCATSKASDQPAHTRSLIRAFACRLNIL